MKVEIVFLLNFIILDDGFIVVLVIIDIEVYNLDNFIELLKLFIILGNINIWVIYEYVLIVLNFIVIYSVEFYCYIYFVNVCIGINEYF